jgi:glycosyltransferase involved in cell wall biosynthesis
LPVFATRVGGTEEIIKDGVNGYLLDVARPESWWEKLIRVTDRQKMQAISTQAWNDARENFSAKHHAEQFAEFYDQGVRVKR